MRSNLVSDTLVWYKAYYACSSLSVKSFSLTLISNSITLWSLVWLSIKGNKILWISLRIFVSYVKRSTSFCFNQKRSSMILSAFTVAFLFTGAVFLLTYLPLVASRFNGVLRFILRLGFEVCCLTREALACNVETSEFFSLKIWPILLNTWSWSDSLTGIDGGASAASGSNFNWTNAVVSTKVSISCYSIGSRFVIMLPPKVWVFCS